MMPSTRLVQVVWSSHFLQSEAQALKMLSLRWAGVYICHGLLIYFTIPNIPLQENTWDYPKLASKRRLHTSVANLILKSISFLFMRRRQGLSLMQSIERRKNTLERPITPLLLIMRSHNPYPWKSTFYWLFPSNGTWSVTILMTSTPTQCQSHKSLDPTTNPSPTATPTQGIGPRPLLFWTPLLFRVVWAPGIPLHCVYCQFGLLPILVFCRTSHFPSLYFMPV